MSCGGPHEPPYPAHRQRILVVDDQASIRHTLGELLELEGYLVETAKDGLDAFQRLRQVLDLMMPIQDGWGFLRARRADPSLAEVPVIVMSARPDAAQSVAELDVQVCLTKPFDIEDLLDALDETWKRGRPCAICGASGTERDLRVFVEGVRTVDWALCMSCWQVLQTGFQIRHPKGSLELYLRRPGFCIADFKASLGPENWFAMCGTGSQYRVPPVDATPGRLESRTTSSSGSTQRHYGACVPGNMPRRSSATCRLWLPSSARYSSSTQVASSWHRSPRAA
jgi:CheY-like chemotaxis protein